MREKIAQIHTNTQRSYCDVMPLLRMVRNCTTTVQWYAASQRLSSHRRVHNKLSRCCTICKVRSIATAQYTEAKILYKIKRGFIQAVLGSRPVLISTFPYLGLELCTKSMGLSVLCLVLISAPLVSNPTLVHCYHNLRCCDNIILNNSVQWGRFQSCTKPYACFMKQNNSN